MKKTILLLVLLLLPSAVFAAEPVLDQPHWSVEVKGGRFAPALENWAHFYGTRSMPEYAASLALSLASQGYVTMQTLRAFSPEEFAGLVSRLP